MYKSSEIKYLRRAYIICGAADCNTKRVIYMIQCRNCGKQYVGQTQQEFNERQKREVEDK